MHTRSYFTRLGGRELRRRESRLSVYGRRLFTLGALREILSERRKRARVCECGLSVRPLDVSRRVIPLNFRLQ